MIPRAARFFHPASAQRIAVVEVVKATERDHFAIEVRRGSMPDDLFVTSSRGPYSADECAAALASVVSGLREEGYWPTGVLALIERLESPSPGTRARAALGLGWRRVTEAVPKLISLLSGAPDNCSLMDALGALGDHRALPLLRAQVTRKLLSRRRSAVEALRAMGDMEGLATARQLALDRLPETLREQLKSGAQPDSATILEAIEKLPVRDQGLCADTIYEIADSTLGTVVCQFLATAGLEKPHIWRYAKSIYKRSMVRQDVACFGLLSHAIEARSRATRGSMASIKSGYDGQERHTRIFGRRTQYYMRRQAWHYFKKLAQFRPELYAHAAAEVLIHYSQEDIALHRGACYLLHRLLWGGSQRLSIFSKFLAYSLSPLKGPLPSTAREEAFPELWDAEPRALLRLLGAAKLAEVHVFALNAVKTRHPQVLTEAANAEVAALLQAPYEPTAQLGLAELERRFDLDHPDWELLHFLLTDAWPASRMLGQRWLRLTAMHWLKDVDLIAAFLELPLPNQRALVVELVVPTLLANSELRQGLATRLIQALESPEPFPGAHEGPARVIGEALFMECNAQLSVRQLVHWLEKGSPAAQTVAGDLLAARKDTVAELGLERLTGIAQHELATVRAAAHKLLRSAADQLAADPSILFQLVESEWEDTRQLAFNLLRTRFDADALGLDGAMGLLDSNRADVQDFGAELVRGHFAELPMAELAGRLVQHPDPRQRGFALELVMQHLPPGPEALAQLRSFCRSILFDVWPKAKTKREVVKFLAGRALQDEQQAAIVASILGDVVRMQGRGDFERAMEAMVRLKLAFPEVPATVMVKGGQP
jgi:hypothetical protein